MNFLVLSCSSYNQLEKAMNLELQEKSNIFQHTHLHALKVFWFNHLNFFKKLGNYPTNFTNSLQFYNLIHLITIYLSLSFYIFIYIYIYSYIHTYILNTIYFNNSNAEYKLTNYVFQIHQFQLKTGLQC